MKIFLDTAHIDTIRDWIPTGLIDGITTNPSTLSKANTSPRERILDICKLLPHGDISVEVTHEDPNDVFTQAQEIARLAPNITVKIPCHLRYYSVIERLVAQGIRINVTLIFTLLQAFFMSKLGVRYVSPFIGRLEEIDMDGIPLITDIRSMLDTYGYETQLLAASIRSVHHLHQALLAGADIATISVDVLKKATHHPLTDQGITLFNADWQKLGVKHFP